MLREGLGGEKAKEELVFGKSTLLKEIHTRRKNKEEEARREGVAPQTKHR